MVDKDELSVVHADLVERLKQDERLRSVEQQIATLMAVVADLPRMEGRLMAAIENARPKNTWSAAGVIVAAAAVVVAILAMMAR